MSEAQRLKHIADRMPQPLTKASELDSAEPTPDGLGTWEGGPIALKGANNWVSLKSRPSQTADSKCYPGIDYATPDVEPLKIEECDNIPCDAGDCIAKAVADEPASA